MLTALMAARNILGSDFDLWQMHGDTEYLEEGLALADEDIFELEAEASYSTATVEAIPTGGSPRALKQDPHEGVPWCRGNDDRPRR